MTRPLLIALALIASSAAMAKPWTLKIQGSKIAEQIDRAMAGVQLELDADRKGPDGVLVNGGLLKSNFTGNAPEQFSFSVPSYRVELGWLGSLKYQVHGIRLSHVATQASTDEFVIQAFFTGSGRELVGSHNFLGEAAVPDISLTDMLAEIRLKPCLTPDGQISYADPRVSFRSKMRSQGLTFKMNGQEIDMLDRLTGYQRQLSTKVSNELQDLLASESRRASICAQINLAIRNQIKPLKSNISAYTWSGTDLTVTLEPN